MTDSEFKTMCEQIVERFRGFVPIDTGNLRYNAVKIEFPTPQECHIYVDEVLAPYMPFTNEPWLSKKWHGKNNPNEHWWEDTCKFFIETIAQELKGELIEHGDY